MSYNNAVDQTFPRRLRSTSVQLGALTALALTLTGCNMVSDDDCDDRSMGSGASGGGTAVVAMAVAGAPGGPAGSAVAVTGDAAVGDGAVGAGATVPDRGGFGTHLASCGG